MRQVIRVGLVGAGFIGRAHGLAIHAVNTVFRNRPYEAVAHVVAESTAERAQSAGEELRFASRTDDWRKAVADCDALVIAVPSHLHLEIARHALESGVPILCEKPVGLSSAEALEIAELAREAGLAQAVGFTYARAPLVRHARALVDSGEIGRPLTFHGRHCEDYLADPKAPFSWRLDASLAGRCGALGDLGYHIIAVARMLCGPVAGLSGIARTVHERRFDPESGADRVVENEDCAGAVVRFEGGATGTIEASRIATGHKMQFAFDLVCERGAIAFDAERMNEIRIHRAGSHGFETVHISPDHPPYGDFLPAPAHGLGFNDLKTIEMHEFLTAVATGQAVSPGLDDAVRIARICEAILASDGRGWIEDPEEASP